MLTASARSQCQHLHPAMNHCCEACLALWLGGSERTQCVIESSVPIVTYPKAKLSMLLFKTATQHSTKLWNSDASGMDCSRIIGVYINILLFGTFYKLHSMPLSHQIPLLPGHKAQAVAPLALQLRPHADPFFWSRHCLKLEAFLVAW